MIITVFIFAALNSWTSSAYQLAVAHSSGVRDFVLPIRVTNQECSVSDTEGAATSASCFGGAARRTGIAVLRH